MVDRQFRIVTKARRGDHSRIRGDKIWIQYDGTNRPIADELVEAGVPKEDIVLGFHPADVRPFTDFAVG